MKYLCLLVLLWCTAITAFAEEGRTDHEKKMSEHYNVRPTDRLEINNVYGGVHVNTWDKNEVTVDVTITSHASGDSRAQADLDRVTIHNESDPGAGLVKFRTSVSSRGSSWGTAELRIDYVINAPKKMVMDLTDRYGDIFLDDAEGNVHIELEYGGISTRALTGKSVQMRIGYSNGNIGALKKANLDMSYSNLSVEKAEDLTVHNAYGRLDGGAIQRLDIDQKSGNLGLDEVGLITGTITYTSFRIQKVTRGVNLDLKYCGLADLGGIAPTVDQIGIVSSYSTVTLRPEAGDNFTIDARASYGDVENKSGLKQLQLEFQEKSAQTTVYTGRMGNGSGRMHLSARYGTITFK